MGCCADPVPPRTPIHETGIGDLGSRCHRLRMWHDRLAQGSGPVLGNRHSGLRAGANAQIRLDWRGIALWVRRTCQERGHIYGIPQRREFPMFALKLLDPLISKTSTPLPLGSNASQYIVII